MSDSEDGHFPWESWISPGKRKRKKNSETDKKCVQQKNSNWKIDEISQKKKKKKDKMMKKKKKKKLGFKEEVGERKKQMKDKKVKKKKKSSVGCDDSFLFTQGHASFQPEAAQRLSPEDVAEDSKKTSKRKKKVAFCLSPGAIAVKRPKFASLSPRESGVLQTEDAESRPPDNDSQGTSDDVNSQDLFITQKTFRPSPVESSGGDVCDEALTQPERTPQPQSDTRASRPGPEHPRANLTGAVRPRHGRSWGQNPFLDELKTKTLSCASRQQPASRPRKTLKPSLPPQKSNTSTQTENFFTPEFCSFLNFRQKHGGDVCSEEPLDLSLPQRARSRLSGGRVKDQDEDKMSPPPGKMSCNGLAPPHSSDREKESAGQRGRKVKATPSPQSESDRKTTDTTPSSEDNETTCCAGKLDMTQVRAVQMRLNESFFFKTKGEESSHRPQSPLMKLAQGRETRSRKGH